MATHNIEKPLDVFNFPIKNHLKGVANWPRWYDEVRRELKYLGYDSIKPLEIRDNCWLAIKLSKIITNEVSAMIQGMDEGIAILQYLKNTYVINFEIAGEAAWRQMQSLSTHNAEEFLATYK